jgi:gliding motility-associated-like protein
MYALDNTILPFLFLKKKLKNISLIIIILLNVILSNNAFAHKKDSLRSGNFSFIENKGQWSQAVLFKAELEGGAIFLEKNRFTLTFGDSEAIRKLNSFKYKTEEEKKQKGLPDKNVTFHAYRMNFKGCNSNPKISSTNPKPEYNNYFIGNDPSKWASNVNKYKNIKYENIYNGIDIDVYEKNFLLKYDFIVSPGANPNDIIIEYEGIEKLKLENENLIIITSVNRIIEVKPQAWQNTPEGKKEIECNFKLRKNKLSFSFPNGYDKKHTLIIDPVLIFASYSGSTADNWGYTATYDNQGFLYAGGNVFAVGYPLTTGAYQTNYAGGSCDIAISKYDTTGSFLIYSTYLGGNGTEVPNSLIVSSTNELFILGTSGSSNYPTTASAYDQTFNGGTNYTLTYVLQYPQGSDIVISRLSADGTNLLSSTYVGGSGNDGLNTPWPLKHNYADEVRGEIMIDKNDNIYIVSSTQSSDFPITSGALQTTFGGGLQDGCIFKIDYNLSNMMWASYLGGNNNEAIYSVVLDKNDNLFVAGGTSSQNFPTTPGVIHTSYIGGSADGFVSLIDNNGSQIIRSTYFGATHYDQVYFVRNDNLGDVYVYGQVDTSGTALIHNAAWNTPNGGQFIAKLSRKLDNLIWSTTFGTGSQIPDISPSAFLVDLCNKIYLSGWGSPILNGYGGTQGLPITANAFQTTTDNNDYYFMVMSDDASTLEFGSFYGGSSAEHVDGGTSRFDKKGRIYQAVCAGCGGYDDFPTTPGAVSNTNNSYNCNNGVIKIDFNLPVVVADFLKPPAICLPATISFTNTSYITSNTGYTCIWDFGDGYGSNQLNPTHTYANAGVYNVTLIVHDAGACNTSDTISHQVVVLANSTTVMPEIHICKGDNIQIGLLPIQDPNITYQWVPSTGLSNPNISNPVASPIVDTEYILLIDNAVCTDTIKQKIIVSEVIVDAGPNQTVCPGNFTLNASAYPTNCTFIWSNSILFNDTLNTTPNNATANVNVNNTTTFYVKAKDPWCEDIDSVTIYVSIADVYAGTDINICEGNTANLSATNLNPANPLTYSWAPTNLIISGANTASPTINPTITTTYTVTATDQYNCKDYDTVVANVISIQANLTYQDVLCYGQCNGQISVAPSGGTAPYTFNWDNGATTSSISNLCQGPYSVEITESSGCSKIINQYISQPDSITVIITDTIGVVCNGVCGGSATVMALGGTPPFTYNWINGQSGETAINLCAGTYYVYVTDSNNCQKIQKVEISDNSTLTATISNTPPSCYGYCDGTATALPVLGTPPYTYLWETGEVAQIIGGLCAGNINVSITDADGCIRNIYSIITEPDELTISIPYIKNPDCNAYCNGEAQASASGGTPPYTYSWSNGQNGDLATDLCSGSYTVTVKDNNGCEDFASIDITEPPALKLNLTASNVPCLEYCGGVTQVTASGGTPPYSYLWSDGQFNSIATNVCAGITSVTVTDDNNCTINDTITIPIVSTFPPVITTTANKDTIYNGQSSQLNTTVIPDYVYSWTPIATLDNPTIPSPIATPSKTTEYIVKIEDMWGCIYYDTVIVYVIAVTCDAAQIFVPNAFSPNNDGKNDILFVRSNVVTDINLSIYDRWGEKVFETNDLKIGWDGTFRGRDCDPGVFVYYITATCVDESTFKHKGNITLIR